MTSIFSGQLYRNFVKDQNTFRLESFDTNRFQRTIAQQAAQGQREKSLREGLETHQAIMADLQTKLSEVTEKLNNLYRRFMENKVTFRKASSESKYFGTSDALDILPDITSTPNTSGYPTGPANILPYDDYDKIRNYSYNPFFGSKAIDASDKNLIRTSYKEEGKTDESAYHENGAFWSTIAYLWGWDIDRVNATYATTNPTTGLNDRQVNVTALQPNKPQYPPLKAGDRFPINWTGAVGAGIAGYPAVNISGLRPGGADFSHATDSINTGGDTTVTVNTITANIISGNGTNGNPIQVDDSTGFVVGDIITVTKNGETPVTVTITGITQQAFPLPDLIFTNAPAGSNNSSGILSKTGGLTVTGGSAHVNVVGKDAVNMGWEFDDLPISLEVTGVDTRPDGTTVPTGYHVVYDIPPTHPFYDSLKVLNGTEPLILDAPEKIVKERVNNPGFSYTGSIFIQGTNVSGYHKSVSDYVPSTFGCHNPGGGSCGTTSTSELVKEHDPPESFTQGLVGTFVITACSPANIVPGTTKISFKYRLRVHQNQGAWSSTSPTDDGLSAGAGNLPDHDFTTHDWSSDGSEQRNNVTITWAPGDPAYYQVPMPTAYDQVVNADISSTLFLLEQAPSDNTSPGDAFITSGREKIWIKAIQGSAPEKVKFEVYFSGDLNDLEIEVKDVEIVTYKGDDRSTWNASTGPGPGVADHGGAKYNVGEVEPVVMVGDPANEDIDFADVAGTPSEVVNKYYPSVYQFTQFNDQYNNSWNNTDMNDIIRSPWEFGMLNIGETSTDSKLSGELFIDLNGRRLNIEEDRLDEEINWDLSVANVSGTGFSFTAATLGVQNAYDFIAYTPPPDDCGDGSHQAEFTDSDPITNDRTHLLDDEILSGEAAINPSSTTKGDTLGDPLRTANPTFSQSGFYQDFNGNSPPDFIPYGTGASNDYSGAVDRIAASSNDIDYTISIPTNDVNILRKENNLLFNLGKIDGRDWAMQIEDPFMEFRTTPGYSTVPRYRVDAGGNIFDLFGKGYYDSSNAQDQDSLNRLYTTVSGASKNGQVSNDNWSHTGYDSTYDLTQATFEDFVQEHDRLSMASDDYNLFDYVPDLKLDPLSAEGARLGELYVGSFPSNFYYYREMLDNSQGELGTPATGDVAGSANFNGDNRAALNFDGRVSNMAGVYNQAHTTVHNTDIPSFVNVTIGFTEQDAKLNNAYKTTTNVVWQGFPGLGAESVYGQTVQSSTNVSNPLNALGNSTAFATMNYSTSSITIGMGQPVNQGGYLVINEVTATGELDPHVVPLPLLERSTPFPSFNNPGDPTPEPYIFDAYGAQTVTRTGSRFMNFDRVIDGVDGKLDSTYTLTNSVALLTAAGGEFAQGDPFGPPDTWKDGVLLHVDGVLDFDMDYPKNQITLGTDPTIYRVMYKNDDTVPKTMFVVRADNTNVGTTLPGATTIIDPNTGESFVHADLQVRALTGRYTVNVTDSAGNPDVDGTFVKLDYDDLGTQQVSQLGSVAIAPEKDRVGRIAADDPRTSTVETDYIGPEIYASPHGYVQPDAQLNLTLVSQDKDGNPKARKLKGVHVTVQSGEQIIPTTLKQDYSTDGPFNYLDAVGEWPIALFEEYTQINPQATTDMGYFVGLYQGITAFNATGSPPTVTVTSNFGFSAGQTVTINGQQRTIASIAGNVLTLDNALSNEPKYGDRVSVGRGDGTQELQMFLNRSFAMSMGAGVKITLDYDEYDIVGYPPTVAVGTASAVSETIGFTDTAPAATMQILASNTGDGINSAIQVNSTTGFTPGQTININGNTRTIKAAGFTGSAFFVNGSNGSELVSDQGQPFTTGSVSHVDYEDFLVAGKGRSGGSSDNEFTEELKRIVDNPEYRELFRHNLFKDIFITTSVNDPFNDMVATKLFLNWDRIRRQVEILQSSFMAYHKSI
ncbi:MAG: hypothetical protein ACAI44_02885 [Candidatus Sericytochromatia bacterium]